jgi:hypothetical protein
LTNAKDEGNGKAERANPDPPLPPGATPFERFEDFAKKIISVPKSEVQEQERLYREQSRKRRGKG